MKVVVAIDGPAASGKSTTARLVAEGLGFCHVNSGLIYRAITWVALRRDWDDADSDFADRLASLAIRWRGGSPALEVEVEGESPGRALHAPEVSERVSSVARRPEVRERALELLREAAERYDLVCDGRDIGTVVFPEAPLKVFLVASSRERARRRLLDHGVKPNAERIAEEAERLRLRDEMDARRELSPLRKAEDAVEVDTTELAPEEVVRRILDLARLRGLAG